MGGQDAQEIQDAHDESSSDLEITTEDALSSPTATRKWDKNASGGNTEARLSTSVKDLADPSMIPTPEESSEIPSQATLAGDHENVDEIASPSAEITITDCGQDDICTPKSEGHLTDMNIVDGIKIDLNVPIETLFVPEAFGDQQTLSPLEPENLQESDLPPIKLETLGQTCSNNDSIEVEENERELDKQSSPRKSQEFVTQEGFPMTSLADVPEAVVSCPEGQECLSKESLWEIKFELHSPNSSEECPGDIVTPSTDEEHFLNPLNSPPMRSRRQNKQLFNSERVQSQPQIDVSRGQDDPTKSGHPVDSSLVKDNKTNDSPKVKPSRFTRQKAKFHRSQSTNTLNDVGKKLQDCHYQGSLRDVKGANEQTKSGKKLFQSKQDLLSPKRFDSSAQVGKLSAMFERQASVEPLNHSQRSKSATNTPRFERKSYGWMPI